jgi:hypothetical protein
VWDIFVCFSKHSLLWDSPLAFILEGVMFHFFLCSLIGAHFFYASWAFTFFNDPSLLLQEYKKRNLFGTLEYLFLVDGWHILRNSWCRS